MLTVLTSEYVPSKVNLNIACRRWSSFLFLSLEKSSHLCLNTELIYIVTIGIWTFHLAKEITFLVSHSFRSDLSAQNLHGRTCRLQKQKHLLFTNNLTSCKYISNFTKEKECLSALCRASFVDVYLAYLKSYGHLKIVKCIGMYLKFTLQMARTPWKMYLSAWNFPGRCSCEFCEIAKKLTLDFKLNSWLDSRLTLKNFSKIFFSMPTPNLKKPSILHHVSI